MTATSAETEGATGVVDMTIDPFAGHTAFAKSVRGPSFRRAWFGFVDSLRDPLDVRADKILDLQAFGQNPQLIIRMPRPMRDDEYPSDIEDRLKNDCERQFVLRNIARLEREVYLDEKIEFDRKPVDAGGFEFPKLASMQEAYAAPELLPEVSYQYVFNASRWRWTMLEVMQWERYFCREIKDKFKGPIWKHDPDTNPIVDEDAPPAPTAPDAGDADAPPDA
jgi:hypothetical protein